MYIYQELSKIFKYKILSNEQIPQYLRSLAQAGKFDDPKIHAVLTLILVRLAEIEDMLEGETYVEPPQVDPLVTIESHETESVETPQQPPVQETQETPPQVGKKEPKDMEWIELRVFAKALGINTSGLKRPQLIDVVNQKLAQQ